MADKSPKIGTAVQIVGKDVKGKIAFVGYTNFSAGKWFGVILDEPKGKNNGCIQGTTYFTCPDNYGIFVRQTQLLVLDDENDSKSRVCQSTGSIENVSFSKETAKRRKTLAFTGIPKLLSDKNSKNVTSMTEVSRRFSFSNSLKSISIKEDASRQSVDFPITKSSTSTLGLIGTFPQKNHEIENLKNEIKDLNEKLETIKIKRAEDQAKIKEAEKTKIQIQQLLEHKAKITEVQADLQRQLIQAKKEAKEAIESKEQYSEDMHDLEEAMELATLDKEMAEEKYETLQAELEQTKEKLEELQIDYEIMKTEMADKGSDGTVTIYQVKQLEQQNERLKEALVKMRDLSAQEKQEQHKMQKELDQQKSEINELSRAKEKLYVLVDDYEKQLGELKEQVDTALGSEEMIERLTERNLFLEDRVRELQILNDDLESLLDVNDQLQEAAKETEFELREELDMSNAKILEGQKKLDVMQKSIADYERTIQKFRDQTEQLQETNHELEIQLKKKSDIVAKSKPVDFIEFKVKYAETKEIDRAIEMDLRQLEVQESNQHVNYLCAFMPEHFLNRGSDHDGILILLLVPRMITKSEILASQVKEKFPPPENISKDIAFKSHKIDQYSFANRLMYQLYFLQSLLHQYISSLNNCSVELFMKIRILYVEMAVQEKSLDYYIDLLRKDQLDENVDLEVLTKSVLYFYNLYSRNLSSEKINCSVLMGDHMNIIGAACESIHTDISTVIALIDRPEIQNSDFRSLLRDLCTYSDDIRRCVKKVRCCFPAENSLNILLFRNEVQEQLNECRENIGQVMYTAFHLRKVVAQQVAVSDDAVHANMEKLKELAREFTKKAYDKDGRGIEYIRCSMNLVKTYMNKISSAMQEGEYEVERGNVQRDCPPIFKIAQSFKEARYLENLKFKLESRVSDICELKKTLKIKNDELSEMNVRKEMAEKKLEIAVKGADERVGRIQKQLDEAKMILKMKEKEFEETLDHLQADIDALEIERGELREKIKLTSKKVTSEGLVKSPVPNILASLNSSTLPESGQINDSVSKEYSFFSQQVENLKLALKHLQSENSALKADRMARQLENLPPLKLTSKTAWLKKTSDFKTTIDFEETGIAGFENFIALSKKSKDLLRKAHQLILPTVVDITQRKPGTDPIIEKMSPKTQLIDSAIKLKTLQNEAQNLRMEIARVRASQKQCTQINADFASFPLPSFSKACNEERELIARVTFPKICSVDERATVPLMVSMNELNQLHAKILF